MTPLLESAIQLFERSYGYRPTLAARAPGRIEVIGNHTDYNGGMVLGAGIDREIVAAGFRRTRLARIPLPGPLAIYWVLDYTLDDTLDDTKDARAR